MDRFVVSATGHSLNYLPHYVAEARGFFAAQGLEVSNIVPRPWDLVLDHIRDGVAEAALGGIWVPAMFHGRERRLVPFAQLSNRAPLALVARCSEADFSLRSLVGRRVCMKGANGASVGIFLRMLLREAGIDPVSVHYIQDLDVGILQHCFAGGMGDYLLIDLPAALAFEAAGHGRLVANFALVGGDIPWSVYYTENDTDPADSRPARFSRALGLAMEWIRTRDSVQFADFLRATFPALTPEISCSLTDLYRENAMWTGPHIDEKAYARWQIGIADAGLTDSPIPYASLIDTSATCATC